MGGSQSAPTETSVHDFTVKDGNGAEVDLGIYKGKVLFIVNVASKCGLTNSNYTELTQLYNKYKDQDQAKLLMNGLVYFPNWKAHSGFRFLRQEPGNNQEIKEFACTRFKVEFPIFQKVKVNGSETSPLYRFLKTSKPGFMGGRIKWNFTKFLVDKNGKVIGRYGPSISPMSIENDIRKAIES